MKSSMKSLGISHRLDSNTKTSLQAPICQILQSYRDRSKSFPLQMNAVAAATYRKEAYDLYAQIANSIAKHKDEIISKDSRRAGWIDNPFTVAVSNTHCAASGGGSPYVGDTVTGKTRTWGNVMNQEHAEVKIMNNSTANDIGVSTAVCPNCYSAMRRHDSLEHYADPTGVHQVSHRDMCLVCNREEAPVGQVLCADCIDSFLSSDTES